MTDPRGYVYHDLAIQPAAPSPEAPAKTDPAAIDLDDLKTRYQTARLNILVDLPALIAAVEALRERVAGFENDAKVYKRELIEETDRHFEQTDRAEAAEAHAVELTEALEDAERELKIAHGHVVPALQPEIYRALQDAAQKARTALAATPSEALARARARDEATHAVEMALRIIRPMVGAPHGYTIADVWKAQEEADKALDAVDALARPAKGDGT